MSGYSAAPSRVRIWAAFAAIYVLWGSNFLAIRFAAETMPPFLMMAVRCAIAGGLLFGWAWLRQGARPQAGHWRSAAGVGVLLFLGCHGLLAWAEQTVPSGVAALVFASEPVLLILLDWATGGPRPGRRAVIGMLLGFAGLAFLVGPQEVASPLALSALLLSSLAWACGSILSRHVALPSSLVLSSGMQLLVGSVALAVVGLSAGELGRVDARVLEPRALGGFAYMVLVSSLVGFTAFTWLMRVVPAAQVGTYAFVNPVVALVVGAAIGGETVTGATLAASAVIVAGVALIVTGPNGPAKGDADDRARVEGIDPGRPGGGVPRVPEADRPGPLPSHAGQSRRPDPA